MFPRGNAVKLVEEYRLLAQACREMATAMTQVFGIAPHSYPIKRGAGELKLVSRAAALAWQHVFGFHKVDSLTKRIPDLVFNVGEPLRWDQRLLPRRFSPSCSACGAYSLLW